MRFETIRTRSKHVNKARRGKTCKRCQASESVQTARSAGKHVSGSRGGMQSGGKTHVCQNMIGLVFGADWLKEQHLHSDWPENGERVL